MNGRRAAAALLFTVAAGIGVRTARSAEAPPFVGETLRYAMSWKIFAGGIMTISVSEPIVFEGKPA
ncbi:MAG TPA: hypothetical protein VFS34_07695, partial [Thermoanaerobaculia bacterium]|nr:hypothetical protein [Thermoanaerobaculia bacterium]